jgi:chloramphenicol 3-O-phosphotransferase
MAQHGGPLIVLNGTSSSGKTSTAYALQKRIGPMCVRTGLDDILDRAQPFWREDNSLGESRTPRTWTNAHRATPRNVLHLSAACLRG